MDKDIKVEVLNMFFFETGERYIYLESISAKLQLSENEIKRIITEYYETLENGIDWQMIYKNSYTRQRKTSFIDAITGTQNKNQRMVG